MPLVRLYLTDTANKIFCALLICFALSELSTLVMYARRLFKVFNLKSVDMLAFIFVSVNYLSCTIKDKILERAHSTVHRFFQLCSWCRKS